VGALARGVKLIFSAHALVGVCLQAIFSEIKVGCEQAPATHATIRSRLTTHLFSLFEKRARSIL
jgi:hypothetical protein